MIDNQTNHHLLQLEQELSRKLDDVEGQFLTAPRSLKESEIL